MAIKLGLQIPNFSYGTGVAELFPTVIAQAQKRGGLAAFIDVEHALDPQYARKLGVNLDDLLVSQPSSGEEALRICETLVRSNAQFCLFTSPRVPRACTSDLTLEATHSIENLSP